MKNKLKKRIVSIFCLVVGVLLFFWWPLSHWFYPDLYHTLLGFQLGSYQDSMVKVIGTLGIIPVMLLITLIAFSILMAATYTYLILSGLFPFLEYINVGLLLSSALILFIIYPWNYKKN